MITLITLDYGNYYGLNMRKIKVITLITHIAFPRTRENKRNNYSL